MRSFCLAVANIALAVGLAACSTEDAAPAPPSPAPEPVVQAAVAPAAVVVFAGRVDASRTVGGVAEDGATAPVALSAPGVDTTYVTVLPGRRVLLAEHSADTSLSSLTAVRVEGAGRASMGVFPAGQYREVSQTMTDGDAVVVELARAGADLRDVFALRAGEAPRLLAAGSRLVALAAGRAAVMTNGDLRSVKLDGSGMIALGPGDGHDQVAEARGDRILFTIHAGDAGDVRVSAIDASSAFDLGKPGVDEAAFAITKASRLVFVRRTAAGAVLVTASSDGKDERTVTPAELDARPIMVTDGGEILFGGPQGALLAVGAMGDAPARVLDPAAGMEVRIGTVQAGHVFYVGNTPHWPALRAAKLDGSGVVSLCESPPKHPFFSGLMPDGRVVYYQALAGQIEGGSMHSIMLDGTGARPVGTQVADVDGTPLPGGPADQDFEVITPSGRLILESEFVAGAGGSQLILAAADRASARLLMGTDHTRYVGLVP